MFAGKDILDSRMTVESFVRDWASRGISRKSDSNRDKKRLFMLNLMLVAIPTEYEEQGESWYYQLPQYPRQPNFSLKDAVPSHSSDCQRCRRRSLQLSLCLKPKLICQLLEDNGTDWHWQWLDDVGVPVLIRGTEFVAYDNEKSATIKATWSSHNNLAGLAIYGLPYDNPEGECPDRPFPILQSIVDAQVYIVT
ncbi:unnamed protein product [Strongylus vulgaris]|uniref:GH18 domain-containing protein n=1 Tax=Strongylus vulgaris TaxID=40348 RepID=A0A3P7IR65_STRVU|nr:unnamed protein product [Strongylus vulgaris]